MLLGPNSGWSEAATAGALPRRIVGPIWLRGELVTDLWIGDPEDPPLSTGRDVTTAMVLASCPAYSSSRPAALILALGSG